MINVKQYPRHDLFQWTKAICAKISLTDVTHNTSWNLGFFGRNRKSVWTKLTKWTERCETHDIGAKLKCCKHRWTKLRSQQVVACLWTHFIVADRYGRPLYGLLNSVPIYVIHIKGQDMTYMWTRICDYRIFLLFKIKFRHRSKFKSKLSPPYYWTRAQTM